MVHLGEVLEKTGFLGSARTRLLRKLRRLFTRTPLQQEEVNILRGILTSVEQYGAKRKGNFGE
jgi:tRNA C32,U32 (ribose-2'-O)-methylase TrmJ